MATSSVSGADAKLASEQSQVFVRRAEQLVQAAFKEGRTRGLQLARDDEYFKALRDLPGIQPWLPK